MTDKYLHRHDLTEEQWRILAPILPGQRGQWGGIAKDNRLFMNAVLWILRTGAPWRDLPREFGKWGSVHQRFRRWRDSGVWERILSASGTNLRDLLQKISQTLSKLPPILQHYCKMDKSF